VCRCVDVQCVWRSVSGIQVDQSCIITIAPVRCKLTILCIPLPDDQGQWWSKVTSCEDCDRVMQACTAACQNGM